MDCEMQSREQMAMDALLRENWPEHLAPRSIEAHKLDVGPISGFDANSCCVASPAVSSECRVH